MFGEGVGEGLLHVSSDKLLGMDEAKSEVEGWWAGEWDVRQVRIEVKWR